MAHGAVRMADDTDREIILETTRIGGAIEVRAISGSDGLEVMFAAPVSASQHDLERVARAKLSYVRAKANGGGQAGGSGGPPTDGRGGLLA
jgi:hypothetical protein